MGSQEVGEVLAKLLVSVVTIALYGGVLERPVHSFDLPVGLGVIWLGQAMFDAILTAGCQRDGPDTGQWPDLFWASQRTDAVIGEHDFDLVGDGFDELLKERSRHRRIGHFKKAGKGDLRCSIDGDKQIELAFHGSNFRNIDMKKPIGYCLNLVLEALVPSTSGRRDMKRLCKHRCNDERVRCGIVGCKA